MDNQNGGVVASPQCAGFWARLGASICDVIILFVLIGIGQGLMRPFGFEYSSAIANIVITLAYYAISLSWKSRTLGQWIFRQIVVGLNSELLPVDVAVKRSAYIFLTYLLLGLPLLTILFSPKKQALHDMMAKTVVIKK